MSDFAVYSVIAAHAADRLEKLKDETGRHGWTVNSKKAAVDYFTSKLVTAIAMMLKTSPYLTRWRDTDLSEVVRLAVGESTPVPLPPDHRTFVDFMHERGVVCFVLQPPIAAQ